MPSKTIQVFLSALLLLLLLSPFLEDLEEREERGRGFAKIREAEGQFVPDYSVLKK